MDNFQKLEQRAYGYLLLSNILTLLSGVIIWIYANKNGLPATTAFALAAIGMVTISMISSRLVSVFILQPLHMLWQTILHIAPDTVNIPPPNIEKLHFGREIVASLANYVYQFAGQADKADTDEHRMAVLRAINIVNLFPQPLFVFNKQQIVTNASASAISYLGIESKDLVGKKIFDSVDLEFSTSNTLESWISDCQTNKVTDQAYWQRVRVKLRDGKTIKQCDIAAYYNRDNASGTEFVVTITDHSEAYDQDDQALSFIALAVHELRTPLTMMRGYVEVFEEELEGTINPELTDYLHKLRISTDQLSAFVTNILNVVRVDENQLSFRLSENDWNTTLQQGSASMLSRAQVLGKIITFKISENLPTVAIDPVSITEVINNLLDNALKYSGNSKEIVVSASLNQEGFVETTVQDFGVGIPSNVVPNLFEKFYRNHRTRNQFGGTGLGLYLCKAIVSAHGGNIWVKSKPGEGSSFTFTIQPYASLADDNKNSDNDGITRHAHGWIKNHSMYRR